MAGKHIAIDTWLEALGLLEYKEVFRDHAGVETLLYTTETEIKDMGVKYGAHRAKIVSSLRILREKYKKGRHSSDGNGPLLSQRNVRTSPSSSFEESTFDPIAEHSKEKLAQELERELSGDPAELRSHCWYHGNITRGKAEQLVNNSGDYILRDSISRPGDFVLTSFWNGIPMHFMVNSCVSDISKHIPKVTYMFEDVSFDSIQELIKYYVARGKVITLQSGAILTNPISRSMPLSYYDHKYGSLTKAGSVGNGIYSSPRGSPRQSPGQSPRHTPHSSPAVTRRDMHKRGGSIPILSLDDSQAFSSSNDSVHDLVSRSDSLPVLVIPDEDSRSRIVVDHVPNDQFLGPPKHARSGSEPVSMSDDINVHMGRLATSNLKYTPAISDSCLNRAPPPKPSRIPSVKYRPRDKPKIEIRNRQLYEEEDDDRDYSDYFQARESPSWLKNRNADFSTNGPFSNIPANSTVSHVAADLSSADGDYDNNFSSDADIEYIDQEDIQPPKRLLPDPPSLSDNERKSPPTLNNDTKDKNEARPLPKIPQEKTRDRLLNNNNTNVVNKNVIPHPQTDLLKKKGKNQHPESLAQSKSQHTPPIRSENAIDNDMYDDYHYDITYMRSRKLNIPEKELEFRIDHEHFCARFLPLENKPLEPSSLVTLKASLLENDVRTLSRHITKVDLDFLKVTNDSDIGVGVQSGLELMTLPHGKQLRQCILERCNCMKRFVIVTILTCNKGTERAAMLGRWLQLAQELRFNLGNHFAFSYIMDAISSQQISRLRDTWLLLRQNHTKCAFIFDTKLRTSYRSLRDGSSTLPIQNVCIPHVLPIAELIERDGDSISELLSWESLDANMGLDILLAHLDTMRVITAQQGLYRIHGNTVLEGVNIDNELLDVFRTECHMRLLWGSKGAGVERMYRYKKFDQLLTVLSNRVEPPDDDGTAV